MSYVNQGLRPTSEEVNEAILISLLGTLTYSTVHTGLQRICNGD